MTRRRRVPLWTILAAAASLSAACMPPASAPPAPAPPPETPHEAVVRIAAGIRMADFEDDRPRLMTLFGKLEPYTGEGRLASRARYWRGFALWRRASNGARDEVPEEEIEQDLRGAVEELEQASSLDPELIDARIARVSCLESLAPWVTASERPKEYRRLWNLLVEAQEVAPRNPRLAWVFGAVKWDTPAKLGGGQDKAFQSYRDGLEWARKEAISDATDPAWGEAELLMSLALARVDGTTRNLDAADHYAHAALNVAPNWRYVRDVLIPRIEAAKAAPEPTPTPARSKRGKTAS